MVEDHRIVLEFSNGHIRLECSERDWYEVFLLVDDREIPLGSERLGYLIRHLAAFLSNPQPAWKWILSLSERHCSTYGQAGPDGSIEIRMQDADARTLADIYVTPMERQAWLSSLEALL